MQRPLAWYAKRIQFMRPAELVYRAREFVTLRRLAAAHRRGTVDEPVAPDYRRVTFCASDAGQLSVLPWSSPDAVAIPMILAGHWPALGYAWQWRDEPGIWQQAPDTGRRWPDEFFGRIPFLAGNPSGDVRVAWEPSRLQQLVALALIATDAKAPDLPRAVALIEDQLLSWVATNPSMNGIHYISAMECALRILAVCHALDMVRRQLSRPAQVWPALLKLVYGHATLIEQRLSLHSSTGNHTVAEAAGLFYAGTLFPEFPGAARWRRLGEQILEREAQRQVLPDGGGYEQAFRYQHLVVDLLGLVVALRKRAGHPPSPGIVDAFQRGSRFLRAFATGPETVPAIGDSDDGFALSRYLRLAWCGSPVSPGVHSFPDSGYTLVRSAADDAPLRIVFDHGPLGMPPLNGHGHADALALTLRLGDEDILIDPGTYSYTGHPEWRRYFRGTAAHNTVTVDGRDQARQEGSFLWSRAQPAELVRTADYGRDGRFFLARHEGYRERGIIHWRGVAFLAPDTLLLIDRLHGTGQHDLALNWHCAVRPQQEGAAFRLATSAAKVTLSIEGGHARVYSSEQSPPRGWRAPAYGVLEPAFTICTTWSGVLPHRFVTMISLGSGSASADNSRAEAGLARLSAWMEGQP